MFDISVPYNWLLKNVTRRDILFIALVIAAYFAIRLIRLDSFPIFTDEGIYIHWSQVAWKDASFRFISLTDGRQPLQTWATIPFLKLFPNNALLAGRLFSVASGFGALVGLFVLCWYLFSKKAGYTAALLYVITPYFIFYDRLALVDPAVNAATIWIFFLSIVLARTRRLDVALILGAVGGFALLAKSSVRLYVALASLGALWIIFGSYEEKGFHLLKFFKNVFKKKASLFVELTSYALLYCLAVGVALLIYNVQRLSQYMQFVEQKNTTFILTLPELIANPFSYFTHNVTQIPYFIFSEMAYIVPIIAFGGLFFLYKEDKLKAVYIIMWLIIPFIALSFIAKVLFPRYVLSLGGFLLLPAAYLIASMPRKKFIGIFTLLIIVNSYFIYTMLFVPAKIPFPQIDRGQYLESWPAGWGIKEIVDFAEVKSQEKPVYLIAEGDFGMAGDVLRVHIGQKQGIHVRAYWPLKDENLVENQPLLKDNHVYVVLPHCKEANYKEPILPSQMCNTFEGNKPLKLISVYRKPGNTSAIYLFELLPATQ